MPKPDRKLTYQRVQAIFSPVASSKKWLTSKLTKAQVAILKKRVSAPLSNIRQTLLQTPLYHRGIIAYNRLILRVLVPDKYSAIPNTKVTIAFHPDLPSRAHAIHQICTFLNARLTHNTNRCDLIIKWKDGTHHELPRKSLQKITATGKPCINLHCTNISKKHVDEIFTKVFGYSTQVNPLTHTGHCVKKSDRNAAHDGHIITCPVATTDPDCIYQLVLDNEVPDKNLVMDIRTPVFGNTIPYVWLTYRPINSRFAFAFTQRERVKATSIFSGDEIANIITFCQQLGMDYGELDIIRHRENQKIYIVDANNTPSIFPTFPYYHIEERITTAEAFFHEFFAKCYINTAGPIKNTHIQPISPEHQTKLSTNVPPR